METSYRFDPGHRHQKPAGQGRCGFFSWRFGRRPEVRPPERAALGRRGRSPDPCRSKPLHRLRRRGAWQKQKRPVCAESIPAFAVAGAARQNFCSGTPACALPWEGLCPPLPTQAARTGLSVQRIHKRRGLDGQLRPRRRKAAFYGVSGGGDIGPCAAIEGHLSPAQDLRGEPAG